jgi:TolA-binding protein
MTESQHDAADALIRTTKRIRAFTTTIQERVHHAFTEHPRSQRMTYCEHFKRAAWTALRMAGGAAALVVHSVFPFVFQTTGSDTVKALHGELKEHGAIGELKEAAGPEGLKEDIQELQEELDEHVGLCEPLSQEDSEEAQEELQEELDELDAQAHVGLLEPLAQEELDEPLEEEVGLCEPLPQESSDDQDESSKKSN